MEMGMDSLWSHLNPRLPPPSSGQEAFSYYLPFAAASSCIPITAVMTNNKGDVEPTRPPPPPPSRSRAAAKKDRHSKICTAGGMRDRRMRLSQDVARRFFALQDKLGFDKASTTVEWLLDMSNAGINNLTASISVSMSLSEEDGSVLLDNNDHIMVAEAETNKQQQQQQQPIPKAKRRAPAPKKNINIGAPVLLPDKASRARARQRARERTKERNRLRSEAPVPAPARQLVVPAACNSYYEDKQEPWELGGVVFAKPRFH